MRQTIRLRHLLIVLTTALLCLSLTAGTFTCESDSGDEKVTVD